MGCRLCGSGFQTIINAAQEIKLGEADVVLTGGSEQMSMSPCQFNRSSLSDSFQMLIEECDDGQTTFRELRGSELDMVLT